MTKTQQRRLDAIRGLEPLSATERRKHDIRSLAQGGYLEFEGQVWKVTRLYRYLDVKWKDFSTRRENYWVTELDLMSLNSGETTSIEWEVDDELELSATSRFVRLRDIQYEGRALKFDDLLEIAEEEEGEVRIDGRVYEYSEDETWAALFFTATEATREPELATGTPVRMFEFEGADDDLTIEAWETDPDEKPEREAFVSRSIRPGAVGVLQTGA